MKKIDYSEVMFQSLQLCGLDRDDINDPTFTQIRDFVSSRLRTAWHFDKWPELVVVKAVTPITAEDGTQYYDVPEGEDDILNIWTRNPVNETLAVNMEYIIGSSGTYTETNSGIRVFLEGAPATVYAEIRLSVPNLFGKSWSNEIAYSTGSQCYFDSGSNTGNYMPEEGKRSSGNFWNCVSGNTNSLPSPSNANWKIVIIPYVFGNYLARAVLADYLRSVGQFDNARLAEGEADSILELEVDKISRQNNQIRRINFKNPY